MNDICAIIRYSDGQARLLLSTAHYRQEEVALLSFIEKNMQQQTAPGIPFTELYHTRFCLYSLLFVPEEDNNSWLITLQYLEKIAVDTQDLSVFAANMKLFFRKGAHDIKNLLANTALLLQDNFVSKARQYLQELQEHYLQQIEDFNKALDGLTDTDKVVQPTQVKPVYFAAALESLMPGFARTLSSDADVIETNFEACPAIVYYEESLLSMLSTLLDNALRYRAPDRVFRLNMYTELSASGHVCFYMEDNGTGIDMQRYGKKLFMPFQRFTTMSKGQGISLHLVKLMVEKSGGQISVSSRQGEGTTVVLHLKPFA